LLQLANASFTKAALYKMAGVAPYTMAARSRLVRGVSATRSCGSLRRFAESQFWGKLTTKSFELPVEVRKVFYKWAFDSPVEGHKVFSLPLRKTGRDCFNLLMHVSQRHL